MKRKLIIGMYLSLAALLTACSDWINVTPKDQVESDKLFDSEIGFKSALIGVYARMTLPSTYGKNMTYGYAERLVQRYDDPWVTRTFPTSTAALYDYKNNATAKSMVASFWGELFRSIANINSLLTRLDDTGKTIVVTDGYWALMKGEALGLRAYHYFDLLRLFGPVYSKNPQLPCLPWRTAFNADPKVLLPATQIVEHILTDLQEAEELLKDDPLNYDDNLDDPFIGLRKHRMNRMAVKALKARVYLWMGDKEKAADEAGKVIEECGFGLARDNTKDVSLYEETIFCLGMADMADNVRSDWADITQFSNEYFITKENVQSVFEPNSVGINDIRYKHGYGMIHGSNGFLCRKYLGEERKYREKVPLIRLVEMYYIMAEAVGLQERNGKDGCWYLNEVRHARGISRNYDIHADTEERLAEALNKEYQKEFFAEGQWFYYLKRNNCSTFYRCPVDEMTSYYVLPTPDDELEYAAGAE